MLGVVNVDTQLVSSVSPHISKESSHSRQGSDGSSVTETGEGVEVSVYTIQKYDNGEPYNKVSHRYYDPSRITASNV